MTGIRGLKYALAAFLLFGSLSLFAQKKGTNAPAPKKPAEQPKTATRGIPVKLIPVYLGNSEHRNGALPKNTFTTFLRQGLTSHDSAGNQYKVIAFDLGYSERGLFEDSVGNIIPVVEYSSVHCPGDKIPEYMAKSGMLTKSGEVSVSLYDRIKAGDTLYFEKIRLQRHLAANTADTIVSFGKPMKFAITK